MKDKWILESIEIIYSPSVFLQLCACHSILWLLSILSNKWCKLHFLV